MVYWFKNIGKILQENSLIWVNNDNLESVYPNKEYTYSDLYTELQNQIDAKLWEKRSEDWHMIIPWIIMMLIGIPLFITNPETWWYWLWAIFSLFWSAFTIVGIPLFICWIIWAFKEKKLNNIFSYLWDKHENIKLNGILKYINKYWLDSDKKEIIESIIEQKRIKNQLFNKLFELDLPFKTKRSQFINNLNVSSYTDDEQDIKKYNKLSSITDPEILNFLEENYYKSSIKKIEKNQEVKNYVKDKETEKKLEHLKRLEDLTKEAIILKKESVMYQ